MNRESKTIIRLTPGRRYIFSYKAQACDLNHFFSLRKTLFYILFYSHYFSVSFSDTFLVLLILCLYIDEYFKMLSDSDEDDLWIIWFSTKQHTGREKRAFRRFGLTTSVVARTAGVGNGTRLDSVANRSRLKWCIM